MIAYLSGPMSGIKNDNFPAFRAAANTLRADGWTIVNPIETDHLVENAGEKKAWHRYLRKDLGIICQTCDAIIVMQGWEESDGARLEVKTCFELGMPIYKLDPSAVGGVRLLMWWRARLKK